MNDYTRKEFTDGLRALADWFDAHEEVELPNYPDFNLCMNDTREIAAAVMLALKPCEKRYANTVFILGRNFGPIKVDFLFNRDTVCIRKVVGTKEIPETHVEAHTIPARNEDIVEWDCVPVLGSSLTPPSGRE